MVRVSVTDVDLIVEEAKTNSLGYWEQNKESKYPRAEWIPEDIKGERERQKRDWRWGSEGGWENTMAPKRMKERFQGGTALVNISITEIMNVDI